MGVIIDIYSKNKIDIKNFLEKFYSKNINIIDNKKWEITYDNPTEASDIISSYIDNNDKFEINMWISLDKDFFINITDFNADKIIRYLFERYPY